MITQLQLQLENLTRYDGRYFRRKKKLAIASAQRMAKRNVRKARSSYIKWHRSQYFLSTGYRDSKAAISRNEDIFIAAAIISLVLAFSYATAAANIFFLFFLTAYTLAEASGINMMLIGAAAGSFLAVTLGWVAALAINALSIATLQGANRKAIKSIRKTMRASLRLTSLTTLVWAFMAFRIAIPLVLALVGIFISALFGAHEHENWKLGIPVYIGIAGVFAAVYNLIKYTLAPHVAIFEPEHYSMNQIFARSAQLTAEKGKWFLAAGYAFAIAVSGLIVGLAYVLDNLIGIDKTFTISFGIIALALFANSVLVMFYRKRRLSRGTAQNAMLRSL